MLLQPAAAQVVCQLRAVAPAEVSNGRRRGFVPAADEAAVAGPSRPAARRRVQGSPSSSPAHSGGEGNNEPAARGRGRPLWVRERSTEWWDRLSGPDCPDAEFRRAFRMSWATFDELSAAVAKEDTALRAAIPVHQRVAVCLWHLATGEPLREVSRRFGLGISTCHNIVLQVCAALTAVLLPKVVHWPDSPAMDARGVHHHTLEAALECPPDTDAFGRVDVYDNRLSVAGSGRVVRATAARRFLEEEEGAPPEVVCPIFGAPMA